MEAFINKMRRLKGVRKQLIVEEAWKALSSANMAEYLRYMYKTVRKYYGEAIVVTQEVDDIISSPVVKESIINNSDCKILLDQRKYMNKFDQIQALLGLTEKEKSQILSINMANNPSRLYKDHMEQDPDTLDTWFSSALWPFSKIGRASCRERVCLYV